MKVCVLPWVARPGRAYVLKGYQGKILRVDLGRQSFREEQLAEPGRDRFAVEGKGAFGFGDTPTGDVLEAVTGHPFTPRLLEIAERIYSLERIILNREGIRRRDDMLPERIMREKIPTGPTKGRILTPGMYAVMLDEYYAARGWDADGVVTAETRSRLGLDRF
jgi:aldehyde:ferredoxin oxidoreductase